MNKLGIYIPTRNRRDDLEKCIRHFIPQLKKYGLSIYISDNNSTDGTEEALKVLKKEYRNIFYKRNRNKLGGTYASNLINLLGMGDTEFAWIFGDDDIVKEHAIDTILKHLEGGCDFLQINAEVWNDSFSKKFEDLKIHARNDVAYSKGDHAAVLSQAKSGYAGFMGSIITRTRYLRSELRKIKDDDLAQKEFLHTTLFFRAIVGRTGMLIAQPLIKYHTRSTVPNFALKTWLVSFPAELKELSSAYPDEVLKAAGTLPTINLIGIACINKLQNPQETDTYKAYVRSNSNLGVPAKAALLSMLDLPDAFVHYVIYPVIKRSRDLTMEL